MRKGSTLNRVTEWVFPAVVLFTIAIADALSVCSDISTVSVKGFVWFFIHATFLAGLFLSPWLVMGRAARYIYCPLIVIYMISCCIQWVTRMKFGMNINGEWVCILLASSFEEIQIAVREILSPWCLVGFLMITLLIVICCRVFWCCKNQKGKLCQNIIVATVLMIAFVMFNCRDLRCSEGIDDYMGRLRYKCPSIYFWWDTFSHMTYRRNLAELRRHPIFPKSLSKSLDNNGENGLLAVFVLGESATRNRWGLYGYERETTPRMSAIKDELIVFTDLVGSSYNTAETLRLLFTEATQAKPFEMNCTLSQLLSAAGYRCSLYANQARWPGVDMGEDAFFDCCSPRIVMNDENLPMPWHDNVLLRYLDKDIGDAVAWKVIFLHLMGSHTPHTIDRYPSWVTTFRPEVFDGDSREFDNPLKTRNNYDNSIVFTDWVLGEIVSRLRQLNRPTMLVYVSDHGESVESDHWRKVTDRNLWEIPMICWLSPEFRAVYPKTVADLERSKARPLQIERLLPGLLALFQIPGYAKPEDNFLDDNYLSGKRMIQNGSVEYDQWIKRR